MSDSEKLENCKKEIRGILLSFQKGCYLPEFNKTCRSMIGKLPWQELGYRSEIDFLYSLHDAVRITQTRNGEYHLMGIADESTKHIQKMVQRQKPMKLRPPPPRYTRQNFSFPNLPPRLAPRPRLALSSNCNSKPVPRKPSPPPPEPAKVVPKKIKEPESKEGPMQQVISLVKRCKRLAKDDLLVEYRRMYNKSLSLSLYGFSSIEECIENIPELKIVRLDNISFIVHQDDLDVPDNPPDTLYDEVGASNPWDYDQSSDRIPSPQVPEKIIRNEDCDNGNVPPAIRRNFQKVAERFHTGCWAADFPECYEEVTSEFLNIQELGYNCLSDLIDDVPDIFVRQPIAGNRKDYHIFPSQETKSVEHDPVTNSTTSLHYVGTSLVDHIVLNLKRILEAYPEGILLEEMLNIYSINCKDVLHVEDLGFNSLEMFLSSIKNRVPLKFDTINGKKSVHLLKLCDNSANSYDTAPEVCENEAIPFDAVFPDFLFKPYNLPDDYDSSKFIPVYTSGVGSPNSIFIQLEDENSPEYKKLAVDLDTFYEGSQSELYMMKNIHIKQGASCVAKWPEDNHWYRVKILSIPSMEKVKVCYVDFGTKDIIPKFLLRYAKKEFLELPCQAIPCRLACLKPPNNAPKYPKEAMRKILSLCSNELLMGRFIELGPDGLYSIILCNTNGDEDIYINDVLINEKLAEVDSKENFVEPNSYDTQFTHQAQVDNFTLVPLQALQVQYHLKVVAAIAPHLVQDESYQSLLRRVSAYCPNVDAMPNNVGAPIAAPVAPPGFNNCAPNLNMNTNAFYNANASGAVGGMAFGGSPVNKGISSAVSKTGQFTKYPNDNVFAKPNTVEISSMGDNDILFEDDDDEIFQQFCQKVVSSTKARHVKRVFLGDNYKVHIIVVESIPYASSGDISRLLWNNKEANYLLRRLQHKDVDIPTVTLSEDGNEALFEQLERYNVKGVQKTTGFKSSIFLYPLKDVMKILNLFGHPSVTLRNRLAEEINKFDPNDACWLDTSPEPSDSEDDQVFYSETDDDKIEKLCLRDLILMEKAIRIKKNNIMTGSTDLNRSNDQNSEIKKLDLLWKKISARIEEVTEICISFKQDCDIVTSLA